MWDARVDRIVDEGQPGSERISAQAASARARNLIYMISRFGAVNTGRRDRSLQSTRRQVFAVQRREKRRGKEMPSQFELDPAQRSAARRPTDLEPQHLALSVDPISRVSLTRSRRDAPSSLVVIDFQERELRPDALQLKSRVLDSPGLLGSPRFRGHLSLSLSRRRASSVPHSSRRGSRGRGNYAGSSRWTSGGGGGGG